MKILFGRLLAVLVVAANVVSGFAPIALLSRQRRIAIVSRRHAGGFEWEDPTESYDQGVDNPYKNPELMKDGEEGMKVDPARLLGPRLNGSNLYIIGMMGCGKSAVGDIVARRKFLFEEQ